MADRPLRCIRLFQLGHERVFDVVDGAFSVQLNVFEPGRVREILEIILQMKVL